jgi:hypothetical protein
LPANLAGRARFHDHKGKRIYITDGSDLGVEEIFQLVEQCARDIRSQPLGSVLAIIHAKGARLDRPVMEKMRWLADGNKPYVKAAAVTGLSSVHKFILNTVAIVTRREFHCFDTLEEAKDFLVKL